MRKHEGRQNLEGSAACLFVVLLKGEERPGDGDLDQVDVLVRDGGVPDLIAVGNGFVLLVKVAANRLHIDVVFKD